MCIYICIYIYVYIYTHSMECAPLSPYVQFDSLSTPEWVFLRTTGWSFYWVTDKVWLLSLVDWIPQDPIADWANLDELPRVCGWIFSWLYNSMFSFKIVIPWSETYFICQKVCIYIYIHIQSNLTAHMLHAGIPSTTRKYQTGVWMCLGHSWFSDQNIVLEKMVWASPHTQKIPNRSHQPVDCC